MKIYFISPVDYVTPDLFSSFTKTFKEQGHIVTDNIHEADCVFFDLHTRIGGYNQSELDLIVHKNITTIFFDAWDYGAMSKEEWPGIHISQIHDLIAFSDIKKIFFVRKMYKNKEYPSYCYPYELTMYQDHIFEPVTKDELFNRPNDICFIGNTSPTRENVTNELKKYFKCDFVLGQERIPHDEWLDRHRNSKLFLEACGGGFGSERPYQLTNISAQLRNKTSQLFVSPPEDLINSIEINEVPTRDDLGKIRMVLNDKEKLYQIYLNGISRMKKYFNEESRSLYVLDVLKQNGIC